MKNLKFIWLLLLTIGLLLSCERTSEVQKSPEPDILTGSYALRQFNPGLDPLKITAEMKLFGSFYQTKL